MHWEETGSFVWMTHQPGFVSCSGTLPTGVEAVAPGSSTTRTSWVSSSSGGVVSTGRSSTAPSAPTKDQKVVYKPVYFSSFSSIFLKSILFQLLKPPLIPFYCPFF